MYGSDISYTGYKYGPDSIVFSYGGNWITFNGRFDLSYEFMYRMHGERGIKYYKDQNQIPRSISGSEHLYDFALTGTIEHTLLANVSFAWQLIDSLKVYTGLAYQYKYNYNNTTESTWSNLQWILDFTFDPMRLF